MGLLSMTLWLLGTALDRVGIRFANFLIRYLCTCVHGIISWKDKSKLPEFPIVRAFSTRVFCIWLAISFAVGFVGGALSPLLRLTSGVLWY